MKFINLNSEEVQEGVFEAREANFEIVSCSEQGQPLSMLANQTGQGPSSVSSMMLTIPPSGTLDVSSLNQNPNSKVDVGYVIARSLDFVGVEVIFNIRRGDGFLTSTNVPITPIITATAFFADIDESTPLNTGVAFLFAPEFEEPMVVRSMIELFLHDDQGQIVAEETFTLDRGHKTARFLHQFFDLGGIEQPFTGTLEIRSSSPVAILPLRQEGLVLTTQALFPPRVLRNR